MRVLSWDVGIINLAFCLLEFDETTKKWEIINWDIINLTNRDSMKCYDCGANPSFYQELYENPIKYTCKNHMKKIVQTPPEFNSLFNIIESEIPDCNCSFAGQVKCEKKIKFTFQNNSNYCTTHAKVLYKKLANNYKLKPFSKKAVRNISLDVLRLTLIKNLEAKSDLLSANIVVIENQPTLKNPRMKAISSTVYDYYLIRGIIDKELTKSNIETVRYMCPSNKLKLANEGDTQSLIKLKGDESKTYKLTKSLAIKYCQELIKPYENWINKLSSHKKKDDLADCFLQGLYLIMTLKK